MAHPRKDLVTNIVDQKAQLNPGALYAKYPRSDWSYEVGYRDITWGDLANSVDGAAWWLRNTLGPGKNFEPLAYIGPNDIRYLALILGASKAGYIIFLTSPRNSIAAHRDLFDRLKCSVILSPAPRPPPISAILASCQLRVENVPSVEELITTIHPKFPYQKSFSEARSEPLVALHTSGSTGLPKPFVYTHDTVARNTAMMSLDPPFDSESQHRMYQGKRVFAVFPPFHATYINIHLSAAMSFDTVMVHPTPGPISSAEGLVEGLKKAPAEAAFVPPLVLQELSQDPRLLEYCSQHLEFLLYGGGDLPQTIGDKIASKIRLVNQFGLTEVGMTANLLANNRSFQDWKYIQFHPDLGIEMQPIADGSYEFHVKFDPKKEEQQPTFTIFPDVEDFTSHDLFVPHPSVEKPDLWNWCGRADDIIVFLNGEKTNPISMEQQIVASNPTITAVLVVGAQRFQAALLVEAATGDKAHFSSDQASFINEIWPSISTSNEQCPKHAQITKSHILFTHPDKPMLRAGKGTIQRAGTLQLYADKINELYEHAENMVEDGENQLSIDSSNLDAASIFVFTREVVQSVLKQSDIADFDNLFTLGLDSLQALLIVRKLRLGLKISEIALSTLYNNSSIATFKDAITLLWNKHGSPGKYEKNDRCRERTLFLEHYQDSIDSIPPPSTSPKIACDEVVILTGSTGALGSYILQNLIARSIYHIYCLNRAHNPEGLQIERNRVRGLSTEFDSTRVTFLKADLAAPSLGLSPELYSNLLGHTTLIIHNAWPVNFNLPLSSFQSQLDGIVNLVKFTASAAASPHLFFLSSISSVMSYRTPSFNTPEEVITADSASGPNGYAESKHISELLLDRAARKLSIKTSFARVGQVAGPAHTPGLWNKAEWLPSLILSSKHLGALPELLGPTLGHIDWVPIDLLAEVLVELAFQPTTNGTVSPPNPGSSGKLPDRASVYHPLNPNPTTWSLLLPIFASSLSSSSTPLRTIPFLQWLSLLKTSMDIHIGSGTQDTLSDTKMAAYLALNPAVKLLDFLEDVVTKLEDEEGRENELEIEKTLERSKKLRDVEGVKEEWVRKWVGEWMGNRPFG